MASTRVLMAPSAPTGVNERTFYARFRRYLRLAGMVDRDPRPGHTAAKAPKRCRRVDRGCQRGPRPLELGPSRPSTCAGLKAKRIEPGGGGRGDWSLTLEGRRLRLSSVTSVFTQRGHRDGPKAREDPVRGSTASTLAHPAGRGFWRWREHLTEQDSLRRLSFPASYSRVECVPPGMESASWATGRPDVWARVSGMSADPHCKTARRPSVPQHRSFRFHLVMQDGGRRHVPPLPQSGVSGRTGSRPTTDRIIPASSPPAPCRLL